MKNSSSASVAIVGAGYMAREHCKAFTALDGCVVAGVVGRSQERVSALRKDFGIASTHDSIAQLYRTTKADAVVITVPEMAALDVYRECAQYPWHILIEKPAGYTLEQSRQIVALSKGRPSKTYVALNRRCYESTELVEKDVLSFSGSRYIHVFDQQDPFAALRTGQPEPVVKHWMYANSVHVIDYLRLFGRGSVEHVERILPWSDSVPPVVMAKVHFSSGDIGIYEGVWRGPGPWAIQIVMDERRWEMRPLEQAVYQKKGERTQVPFELSGIDTRYKAGIYRQAQYLCAMVRGEEHRLVSIEESFESMLLVNAIFGV